MHVGQFCDSMVRRSRPRALPACGVIWIIFLWCPIPSQGETPREIDAADFETLQQAMDALPASGGIVRIPPGEFTLQQPLVIKTGDTRVVGAGSATHIINKNESGLPAILIENPDYHGRATPKEDRLWRVSVADLRVSGNAKSGAGLDARYVEEIFVHGVSISRNGTHGIRLHYCYEDPRISNNLLTYNGESGLQVDACHDIIVSANQFEENLNGLVCRDSFNLTMNGNNLDDHLKDGLVIENTYGSVASGNMIEECQGWAVVLDRDCYGITLSANVIAHDFAGGIDLRDAHGCAVTGNTFTIVKQVGLAIRENSAGITVTGNNFSDSWIGRDATGKPLQKRSDIGDEQEANPNAAAGILLENCEAVVISGNLFSRLSSEAVKKVGDCRKILSMANGAHEKE